MGRNTQKRDKKQVAWHKVVAAAWWVAGGILGSLLLLVALTGGGVGACLDVLRMGLVAALLLGLFTFITRDARRASKGVGGPPPAKARPDGDLSDVAGIPRKPPWMG